MTYTLILDQIFHQIIKNVRCESNMSAQILTACMRLKDDLYPVGTYILPCAGLGTHSIKYIGLASLSYKNTGR